MFELEFSQKFKKRVKKINPQRRQKLPQLFKLFQQNPFSPKLKTHKLSGKLSRFYAFSVSPNLKIVFYKSRQTLILIDIGSHDQVYR